MKPSPRASSVCARPGLPLQECTPAQALRPPMQRPPGPSAGAAPAPPPRLDVTEVAAHPPGGREEDGQQSLGRGPSPMGDRLASEAISGGRAGGRPGRLAAPPSLRSQKPLYPHFPRGPQHPRPFPWPGRGPGHLPRPPPPGQPTSPLPSGRTAHAQPALPAGQDSGRGPGRQPDWPSAALSPSCPQRWRRLSGVPRLTDTASRTPAPPGRGPVLDPLGAGCHPLPWAPRARDPPAGLGPEPHPSPSCL